ncbi:MAG: lysophospholipid acyltransferase (LPLAT)-like uncharacterized protein [Hyphomicrobiaceae bacterium]|jgi:lysophospholipid acyltransferase (LPLAT)-like uncharacterized protein
MTANKKPKLSKRLRRNAGFARAEIAITARVIWLVMLFVRATTRQEVHGIEGLLPHWKDGPPVIMAFWHGRSIMLPFFYKGPGVTIMNSTHRDGQKITRALGYFGIDAVGGSSRRGGVGGLLGLVRANRKGRDLALIPDGPRGPAGEAKGGVAELARATGAPVFPVAFSASRCVRATSWDRMMIPVPGARVVVVIGEPLLIRDEGGGRSPEARQLREDMRSRLEVELTVVTRRADQLAGRPAEST